MAIETLAGLIRDAGLELPAVPTRANARFHASTPGYEGATYGRRTVGWQPGTTSVNSALLFAADTLRARSRDLIRRNTWAFGGVETFTSEVIGTGIVPRSLHSDPAKRDMLQKLFARWTDHCDADGLQDFYGLQKMAVSAVKQGGEVFVRLRPRLEKDGLSVPLQLQLLEAEHAPINWNNTPDNGNEVFAAVERNLIGQRVAYWLYPRHPGEFQAFSLTKDDMFQPKRVPAVGFPSYTSGVFHVFEPIRPGQLRGEPALARVLIALNDLDKTTDAVVMRAQVAALYAAFITENDPEDPLNNETQTLPDGSPAPVESGIAMAGLEPGTMQKLRPGESVEFSNPPDVGANYDVLLRTRLREIAKGLSLTYEMLTGDLTGVNFSSIRAGLLETRRKFQQFQEFIVNFQFNRKVWRAFVESAVMAGIISAADYNTNQDEYLAVKWVPQGWPWVDPQADIAAVKDGIRNGLSTRSIDCAARGYDSEEIDRENAADNARADDLELVYDSDARQTSSNGMRPDRGDATNPDGLQGTDAVPSKTPTPTKP